MTLPTPEPGLVIRYAFLWRDQAKRRADEGRKDRPCAVVLTTRDEADQLTVVVLPITHSEPSDPALAVEVPPQTKRRLGLDGQRSWIVVTDANRFVWPGYDLRPVGSGDLSTIAYGFLPPNVFREVRDKLATAIRRHLTGVITRD